MVFERLHIAGIKSAPHVLFCQRRLLAEYGFCERHQRKVPVHHLRPMTPKECRENVTRCNARYSALFRSVPHIIQRKDDTLRNESTAQKQLSTCTDAHPCADRPDQFCHLHNWRQEPENLVKLSDNPPFYACTTSSPCSILTVGKKRNQIKHAKTKFSVLARARCVEHHESRNVKDMTWCVHSKNWVCGPWSPCDAELIRRMGTNYLREEFYDIHSQRTKDLQEACAPERMVCATHCMLRDKKDLVKITPTDERLRDVYVCQRANRCTHYVKNAPLNIEANKLAKRLDRPGDWYCMSCSRRNGSMDVHCKVCNTARSSKCRVVEDPDAPGKVYPGCTPGDWGCTACKRLNYAVKTRDGRKVLQVVCFSCGTAKNSSCFIVK